MFEMLLGHLIGDYLLQNNLLALNKHRYNLFGWIACFVHCCFYTTAVIIMMADFRFLWIIIVFLSHFLIDKFGVAEKYLKLVRGRSLVEFIQTKNNYNFTPFVMVQAGISAFVYVVCDNTMHLLVMYVGYNFIGK